MKTDEAFTNGKGYYKLIAENSADGLLKKYIFNFNKNSLTLFSI